MQAAPSSPLQARPLANPNSDRGTFRPMSHGNALPVAVNAWIQQRLLRWLAEQGVKRKALAGLLGISGAHVSNILNHGRGIGAQTEEQVARLLGISVDELRRQAKAEWKGDDTIVTAREDRYPNRVLAVEFMRAWVDPEAVRQIESMSLESETDMDPKWWADQIESADRRVKADRRRPERVVERERQAVQHGDDLERATKPKRRARG